MSLRDQMLKAGLVNKKKVRGANRDLKQQRRKDQSSQERKAAVRRRAAEAKAAKEKATLEAARVARDERLRLEEARERRRTTRQLINSQQVPAREGPIAFFHRCPEGPVLHRMSVPGSTAWALRAGQLAIAWVGPDPAEPVYVILPAHVARKVVELEPRRVLFFNTEPPSDDDPTEQLNT